MATTKDDILEALSQLDPNDDTQWTDDGGPRMDVLQKFTNDKTLTRANVNEAAPQFSRTSAQDGGSGVGGVSDDVLEAAAPSEDFDPAEEPEVNGLGEPLTQEQVKTVLERRVQVAENALTAARAALSEAHKEVLRAEQRSTRAILDLQRQFPPVSASEAIHAHIASQQKRLLEQVTGQGAYGRSQIDQGMERSNTRGWTRPVRPVAPVARAG
jgi:hypothetical protein